jgi:hypothetical protein
MDSTSLAPRALAELRTLGPVRLHVGGSPRLERRRKSLALLAFLARHAPARLRRADLAPLLWPSSTDQRARQSLRQALAELRHALGDVVQSTAHEAWLDPESIRLDVAEFERDMDVGRLEDAQERLDGTYLEGLDGVSGASFDLWLAGERERMRSRTSWLVTQLIDRARAAGDAAAVGRWTTLALERAPQTEDGEPVDVTSRRPSAATRPTRREPAPVVPLRTPAPFPLVLDQSAALSALAAAWNRACRGGSEALLLEGDAGLGKSHLIERFLRSARIEQPQSVTLAARALEGERCQAGSLVRHLLEEAPASAMAQTELPDDDARRLAVVAAKISGVVPLLVLVDDTTLADEASQEAIGALVEAPPAGALVVLAARPLMLSDVRFRGGVHRNGALQRISLAPMNAAAVEMLLRALLPIDEALIPSLAERLRDERLGNPGLIETTITMMVDDGYLTSSDDGIWRLGRELPSRLPITADTRERTRRLVPRLSAEAREVLEAAAIPGDAVDVSLIGPMVELEPAAVDAALYELASRRLLRVSMRGDGWLEFVSGAVRHAVLDQMLSPRRRALQRALERASRHRQGAVARDRIAYARPVVRDRSALGFLRSTLTAAAGLLQ